MEAVNGINPLKLSTDICFKTVFSAENSSVIASFLEAVFGIPEGSIGGITIVDPHLPRRSMEDKLAILDLRLVLTSGELSRIRDNSPYPESRFIPNIEPPAWKHSLKTYASRSFAESFSG